MFRHQQYACSVRWLFAITALFTCIAHSSLVCDAPKFDFGALPDTALSVSHTFEVRNMGTASVTIAAVRTSCDCLAASLAHQTLRPGECTAVDTHFTFGSESGPQLRAVHLSYGPASAADGAQTQVLSLHLRGTILPPVLRSPNRLDLGNVLPGSVTTGTVNLLSGRCGAFSLRAVALEGDVGSAEYAAGVRGTNHLVRLLISSPVRTGSFSGMALASTDMPEMPTVPIFYAGRTTPVFEVRPASLTVRKDCPLDAHVAVGSPYAAPFRILSATTTDPRVSVTVTQTGASARLSITAKARAENFADALVRLTTDHPVCRMIEIPIRAAPRD